VLLDLWNMDSTVRAPSLGAALLDSGSNTEDVPPTSSAVDRLRALVRSSSIPRWSRDALEKRLDHFIAEDARIPEAVDAFRHADERRIGRLAEGSQADAETLLGNQIPETSALARAALELGAFASSSFGAGFGGSVWALVEHDRADAFARRWRADAFIAAPGPPVVELSAIDMP
jgi:galactokinase